ncbi:MAG: DUF3179 domain-containing protein [Thermoanaerobaculia bacterium]|nr:DUF3179 domain-containing protein [Thermoanaerobaculia bacterium]
MNRLTLCVLAAMLLTSGPVTSEAKELEGEALVETFFALASKDGKQNRRAEKALRKTWHEAYAVMCLEMTQYAPPERRTEIFEFLEKQTGEKLGADRDAWWRWIWREPRAELPSYALLKSRLYGLLDPRFSGYFDPERERTIRLDEVRWGGVKQDGIPPLRSPKMLSAQDATYLGDGDVVFGLEVNGDARAYPKRILAWHEMFTDAVGGVSVAGVYCTLCGTMIVYDTSFGGTDHHLGTSGFLYRSNKLMYDRATQSLWSTFEGEPVIGPLVGKGIRLEARAVVTTTWSEWLQRHPDTQVLSLETGHRRDYSEGAAYRDYFATDKLMFSVPELDDRLANKDEVLAIDLGVPGDPPLAVSAEFLSKNAVWHEDQGGQSFVVLTDPSGANRVYASGTHRFVSWQGRDVVVDSNDHRWTVTERELVAEDGRSVPRLPAYRAFWFGWRAAHPDTRLVR